MEKYHFIGIAGIGMSGIARLLLQQNQKVSGSDISNSPLKAELRSLGAEIYDEHSASNVSDATKVIYSSDIKEDHVELVEGKKRKLFHRSEMLAEIFHASKMPLAVTGTHGKTTTSSLLVSALIAAKCNPSYAVGGILQNEGVNSNWGTGIPFVIEADESDGSFLHYFPFGAIITNIDFDHMNHYKTEEALLKAFKEFANHVTAKEKLVWCGDDQRLCSLKLPGVSYGFSQTCDFQIKNYQQSAWEGTFDLVWKDRFFSSINISLPGRHAAFNAAAVFVLCFLLGVEERGVREGLASFKGVQRRTQRLETHENITIIDDYAHHPTEIEATLKGIRKAIGHQRLIAVFQPHRYSRLAALVDDLPTFYKAFLDADHIFVTDLYSAGESPIQGINTELVLNALKQKLGSKVEYCPKPALISKLHAFSHPLDVYAFLGAGDITKVAHDAADYFKRNGPKKWQIGVVFGGPSVEHSVSINSARFVVQNLSESIFEVKAFGVSKNGEWYTCQADNTSIMNNPTGKVISAEMLESLLACDLFFPIMHGTFGEDGVVQGFLETLGKPYVGCNHRSSAVCMDKVLSKKIAAFHGINVVPFVHVTSKQWKNCPQEVLKEIESTLTFPLIVKPSHLGSSVCISEVFEEAELEEALHHVFKADTDAVIENRLIVRDIEFAVVGNEEITVFPPGEVCTGGKIYSYEDKVGSSGPNTEKNAMLSPELIKEGIEIVKKVYQACGCHGWSRVDLFLDQEGIFWFNEINPIPGCTSISLYPQICELHGLTPKKLMNELVLSAFAKFRDIQHKRTFQPPVVV